MITIPSVQAQNAFGALIDSAQRQMVSVTRRGRPVAIMMSPQVLEDYVDAQLALHALNDGFATEAEVNDFLSSIQDA